MMKRIWTVLLVSVLLLLLYSCASSPEPVPEPVPEEAPAPPPPEPRVEAPPAVPLPESEMAEAQKLRDLIQQHGLAQYAREAFEQAEALFHEGESQYGKDNDKARIALEGAAGQYRSVIDTGADTMLTALRAEAEYAKKRADEAGIPGVFSDDYAVAAAAYADALRNHDEKNYEEAARLYTEGKQRFQALELRADALQTKNVIDDYTLAGYARIEYDEATVQYLRGERLLTRHPGSAIDAFDQAGKSYSAALEKAGRTVTGNKLAETDSVKVRAEEIKAPVAVKAEYADALTVYQQGVRSRRAGSYLEAYRQLEDARKRFEVVYALALEKKTRAEQALQARKLEMEMLEALAKEAENELEASGAVETVND